MSKKGDKTTSMEIPPWLEASLKPYITDAVNKGQAMSDAAWQWGMANNPQGGMPKAMVGTGVPYNNPKDPADLIPSGAYQNGPTMGDLYGG